MAGPANYTEMFDEIVLVGTGSSRGAAYAMMNYSEAMISRYFTKY